MPSAGAGLHMHGDLKDYCLCAFGMAVAQSGAIVALWTTNRERLLRFVESELLEHWGLRILARWWVPVGQEATA